MQIFGSASAKRQAERVAREQDEAYKKEVEARKQTMQKDRAESRRQFNMSLDLENEKLATSKADFERAQKVADSDLSRAKRTTISALEEDTAERIATPEVKKDRTYLGI
jgi:hypothetical protein